MGVQPPFLYDAVKSDGPNSPYREFNPKAYSQASLAPKPRRPKQDGPLVSFNQHPDSYLILPSGNTGIKPMNPSVKSWVKWARIVQLVLRCLEILCAVGLLAMMIMIKGVDASTGWIMRIVPGIAVVHTLYGIYHLGRKPGSRPPASSASYALFASFFDVSVIPFYVFSALVAFTPQSGWTTVLPNGADILIFSKVLFYLATVGAGLHFVSLGLSLYLAVTFRKITKMPPDMNPLEDNLTSRHKRNKSSVSTVATSVMSEKRLSAPLESKRSSGVAYEDLSRPPTIPFFHTRTQSTDSFSTYRSTPPPSRDARLDLPSRQYQISNPSARSSMADLKRTSGASNISSTPPKRAPYTEVPLSEYSPPQSHRSSRGSNTATMPAIWSGSDSFSKRSCSNSPQKPKYQPLHQRKDSFDDHPNPLATNPPTPRFPNTNLRSHPHRVSDSSPLSEISHNRNASGSGDIGDIPLQSAAREVFPRQLREVPSFKARYYGELRAGTPPVMIGGERHVSSGNDYAQKGSGFKVLPRREVSGKIAEEGRGGEGGGWGNRWRKVSGL